jgi:hypothetical protein
MRRMDKTELQAANCWFNVDYVPKDQETTAWKRLARYRQAKWREAKGLAPGFKPYAGGTDATAIGSRIALDVAEKHLVNFISEGARNAVRQRLAEPERYEMLQRPRLLADLLSSMPLCFNLFGDLYGSPEAASRAVRAWWPDAPAGAVGVRFEYSPGRRNPTFLGNQSAFDVAFEITPPSGPAAIVGVETKYHEHVRAEAVPAPKAMRRYAEVTETSRAFRSGWREAVLGTDLQQIWLDHLLLLSMLQHPSRRWSWGRFVLVAHAGNPSFVRAARRYRDLLADPSSFEFRTIEDLLAAPGALDGATVAALRQRYL